jgi:hypothetical protein
MSARSGLLSGGGDDQSKMSIVIEEEEEDVTDRTQDFVNNVQMLDL